MSYSKGKIRVLVADDVSIVREGLRRILQKYEDIEVIGHAGVLKEAVALATNLQPDVVLMDLRWYGDEKAGVRAIERIRVNTSQTRVLAITAYEHIMPKAIAAGASVALSKDISEQELVDTIRSVIREPVPVIESTKMAEREPPVDDLTLFVGALAHRLGNLLGWIPLELQVASERLREGDTPGVQAVLERVHRGVQEALDVINRVSKASRPLELEISDVNELLALALGTVKIPENVVAHTQYTECALPVVGGEQLIEVFVNLVTNAIQAMPSGGTLDIGSKLASDEQCVEVWITDSGPGIPEEIKQHLFKAFVTSKESGQGLGLWLSKQIVERLGGDIYVQSSAGGEGATFVVRLPLHKG